MLRDAINDGLKEAMKAKDQRRVSTLRLINAAFKNADIEARGVGKTLGEDALLGVLQKMIKQRQESVELYEKGGRADLATQEREEIAIIRGFLPQQMDAAQARAAIEGIIAETGAASVKDMGKVMAALRERYAGRMDFGQASGVIKGLLAK
ncbi:MAG: GatB/YqeY domain-containing protein [Variibacter sp.]|nr:GatB/YqeY domain-containing protein [Variibacter sp.]